MNDSSWPTFPTWHSILTCIYTGIFTSKFILSTLPSLRTSLKNLVLASVYLSPPPPTQTYCCIMIIMQLCCIIPVRGWGVGHLKYALLPIPPHPNRRYDFHEIIYSRKLNLIVPDFNINFFHWQLFFVLFLLGIRENSSLRRKTIPPSPQPYEKCFCCPVLWLVLGQEVCVSSCMGEEGFNNPVLQLLEKYSCSLILFWY